jgi:hypothetical protein
MEKIGSEERSSVSDYIQGCGKIPVSHGLPDALEPSQETFIVTWVRINAHKHKIDGSPTISHRGDHLINNKWDCLRCDSIQSSV